MLTTYPILLNNTVSLIDSNKKPFTNLPHHYLEFIEILIFKSVNMVYGEELATFCLNVFNLVIGLVDKNTTKLIDNYLICNNLAIEKEINDVKIMLDYIYSFLYDKNELPDFFHVILTKLNE